MLDFGAVGAFFDALQSVNNMFSDHRQRHEAKDNALRMLLVEVEQNTAILGACHLQTDNGPPATDPGYFAIAKALSTNAHLGILMTANFSDDEEAVRDYQQHLAEVRASLLANVTLTIDFEGTEKNVRLGDAERDSLQGPRRLDERKPVGLLEASTFVVSRVGALVALSGAAIEAGDAMKAIRPRSRLLSILAYETTIRRELNRLGVVPRIRLD